MKLLVLSFFLVFFGNVNAQSIKIYGSVFDSISGSIPGATVMLVGAQDSILKSFTLTDNEGNFVLPNVKPNDYLFKVSYFGYDPYTLELSVTEKSHDTVIGKIQMPMLTLDNVVVKGHFIPIQIKGDTVEYDSRAFETDEHDAVEELLKQLPGVEVAADGTIKAQGKTVGKILVDGEEFFGGDPTLATKNLPADAIKKVQVFDKQSDMAEFTGVDDGDEVMTINLKLKDSHKQGAFGNLDVGVGMDAPSSDEDLRYRGKGNIHYFKNKWQASLIGLGNNVNETGFSLNDYINFQGGVSKLMSNGGLQIGDELALSNGGRNDGYLNTIATGFNFNYKPSNKTTLNGSAFFNRFDNTFLKQINRTTSYSDSSIITNQAERKDNDKFNNKYKLHLEQKIDSTQLINVTLFGSWDRARYFSENVQDNSNSSGEVSSSFETELDQSAGGYSVGGTINYRKKYKKVGQFTGGGISYDMANNIESTQLDYSSTLYSQLVGTTSYTNQLQENVIDNSNFEANWMWSQSLSRRSLLQFELAHIRRTESRDKRVDDVFNNLLVFNSIFSANGAYLSYRHQADVKYKYIKKKIKATVLARYQNVNMSAPDLLESAKMFHYVLPAFRLQWNPKKTTDIEVDYSTRVTLPTLNHLQDLPNNLNPSEILLGNADLTPEYSHDLRFQYNRVNQFNFTHVLANIMASYVQNNIAYSQTVNEFLVRELKPENLGDEKRLTSYINFGTSFQPIKTKISATNTSSVSSGQVKLNSNLDNYTSVYSATSLTLENTKKKILDASIGSKYTWSNNLYRENTSFNNNFSNWSYSVRMKWKIKKRVVISADLNHYFYPDFELNNEQVLLNSKIAVNLLKSRKLQVYIAGFDLLGQNLGISQNYSQNIYEEVRTTTLSRYLMLGFKYAFQKLGTAD